jgi:plastocyanin domain-containing protein
MKYGKILFLIIFLSFSCLAFAEQEQKNVYKASIDADGIQRINITAGEYFFSPNYIIVKVNVPVELSIKKEPGITPHDIVIKEPEAGIDFSESLSTDPKTIKFLPKKTGKYTFYCDKKLLFFKSHRARGMEGTIEVTE